MLHNKQAVEELYQYIADEEDARVCTDITDAACTSVPGNFFTILIANSLTKLGDELCNAKTILPWLLTLVGAPLFFIGLLVPIRESGSLLPQLLIAAYIRSLALRKWVWSAGSVLQAVSVCIIAVAAFSLTGIAAGLTIIGALVLFSLARGLCSVAHKDVMGKTIPKSRRGRLGGWSGSVAGIIALATGLLFIMFDFSNAEISAVAAILLGAAACWLIAGAVFASIDEEPGATEGGGNALEQALANFALLKTDLSFRRFVIVRSLLLCSALTAPFIIQLSSGQKQTGLEVLGYFIIANGLASIVSNPLWGKFADFSSRRVMIAAGSMTAVLGFAIVTMSTGFEELARQPLVYPVAFFILGIAHSGVRLGRKTYLVDMATGNKRTDYVAVSNTVIGAVLLGVGMLTGIIASYSTLLAILILSLAGAAGAALAACLSEV